MGSDSHLSTLSPISSIHIKALAIIPLNELANVIIVG